MWERRPSQVFPASRQPTAQVLCMERQLDVMRWTELRIQGGQCCWNSQNSRRGKLQRPSGFWLLHQACLWGSRRLVGKPGAELTVPGFLVVERWDSSCWQRLSVKGRHRSALAKSGLHGPRCWMRAAGRAVTPPIITLGLSCLTGLLLLGHRVLQGVDSSLLII